MIIKYDMKQYGDSRESEIFVGKGKGVSLELSQHENLSQVLAGGNHHGLLSSFSTDILCSWTDELLFSLVLLLL